MTRHAGWCRRRGRGLTLVEVVVSLAVLSLVVLALGASLRGMAGSARRFDAQAQTIEEMRVASGFLRDTFASVLPIRPPASSGAPPASTGAAPALLFEAASEHLAWIAVMPARFGAAGRHAFLLRAESQPDGTAALVLRYAPWSGQSTAWPDWDQADSRVLVRELTRLQLRYGGHGLEEDWRAEWQASPTPGDATRSDLPPRVRIELASTGGSWPPLVLALRKPAVPGSLFTVGGN